MSADARTNLTTNLKLRPVDPFSHNTSHIVPRVNGGLYGIKDFEFTIDDLHGSQLV